MARKEPREASAREFMETLYGFAALDASGVGQATKDAITREGLAPCKQPPADCRRDARRK